MTDYIIAGVCPSCHQNTTFKYEGEVDDGADWVVTLYTCQNPERGHGYNISAGRFVAILSLLGLQVTLGA